MSMRIRRIHADEWQRLRAFRLHALADAPMAFGSTLAKEEAFSDDVWHDRAAGAAAGVDRITFIAEQEGRWLGLATGLLGGPDDSDDSFPTLVGMFVDGSARRRGIGADLVENIVRWVQDRGYATLVLWVTSNNEAAVELYRQCFFRPTGATRPLSHSPTHAELEMMRDLK
jgi:GNAT superfamily N-acetyltransferase